MPSENSLQILEFPSPQTPPAAHGDSTDAAAPAPQKSTAALQQRRLVAARDINAKIGGLEQQIAQLSSRFAQSQASVKSSVSLLQQRTLGMMADLLRVSTRLERNGRRQQEQAQQLEQQLNGSVAELGRRIEQTSERLQLQKTWLGELQDRHETLHRLHLHLEKLTGRQGQALGILTAETRQQLQITRTHIEGLNALHREQERALLALASDHDLLAIRAARLEAQLSGLSEVVSTNAGQTRQRFRAVAAVLGLVAVVSLGLIAYFQLNRTAMPVSVKLQLAGLSQHLSQQAESGAALGSALEQQTGELRELYTRLQQQQVEIGSLRTQSRQALRAVKTLELELASLQAAPAVEAASAEPTAAGAAAEEPPVAATENFTLPRAYPGTRPVY
jgi:chromosome segregation ATPase